MRFRLHLVAFGCLVSALAPEHASATSTRTLIQPAEKEEGIIREDHEERLLRGGGYSRGGGRSSYSSSSYSSSYSSSSSYSRPTYHGSNYYGNSGAPGGVGWQGFALFIFFSLVCMCCPCILICVCTGEILNLCGGATQKKEREALVSSQPNDSSYGSNTNRAVSMRRFEDYVEKVKEEVEQAWSEHSSPLVGPHSGTYATSYVDRTTQVQWNATLNIYFTRDFTGRGYRLSGDGQDVDGITVIEDGYCNYDGTAWWKERTVTRDLGLQVVSRGKFDFATRTFRGNWLANSGEGAAYITFKAVEPAPYHPPPSAPMEDMPMAMATTTKAGEYDDVPTIVASAVDLYNN